MDENKKELKNGKKKSTEAKIAEKSTKKAAEQEYKKKKLYRNRRLVAAIGISAAYLLIMLILKAFHCGPMIREPEYRHISSENPVVEIYEYTDLACPACAMANRELHDMLDKYSGSISLHFKHYPLNMHRWARKAASYANCAGEQGKFFEYANMLYENQNNWEEKENEPEEFLEYAESLGLDSEAIAVCLANPDNEKKISLDIAEGNAKGVEATPSFIVNGKMIIGTGALHYARNILKRKTAKVADNGKK